MYRAFSPLCTQMCSLPTISRKQGRAKTEVLPVLVLYMMCLVWVENMVNTSSPTHMQLPLPSRKPEGPRPPTPASGTSMSLTTVRSPSAKVCFKSTNTTQGRASLPPPPPPGGTLTAMIASVLPPTNVAPPSYPAYSVQGRPLSSLFPRSSPPAAFHTTSECLPTNTIHLVLHTAGWSLSWKSGTATSPPQATTEYRGRRLPIVSLEARKRPRPSDPRRSSPRPSAAPGDSARRHSPRTTPPDADSPRNTCTSASLLAGGSQRTRRVPQTSRATRMIQRDRRSMSTVQGRRRAGLEAPQRGTRAAAARARNWSRVAAARSLVKDADTSYWRSQSSNLELYSKSSGRAHMLS
ncbi:hypothetical protein Pelo_35 [Pelomyxa schiedti]|nr:hypothetical protein Pelo_35 [Pelomyxa schiedti]